MDGAYKGVGGWEGGGWMGGGWGWVGKPKASPPCYQATESGAVPSTDDRNVHKPQDRSRRQQLGTQPILISAPQWANRPCNAPTRFYIGKKLSVKADLAIYSHAVDVGGRCMSESLILRHNLDFSFCNIMVGFCKSSQI